jgi:hypothetical protein
MKGCKLTYLKNVDQMYVYGVRVFPENFLAWFVDEHTELCFKIKVHRNYYFIGHKHI